MHSKMSSFQAVHAERRHALQGMVPRRADLHIRSAKNGAVLLPGLSVIRVRDLKAAMALVVRGSQNRATRHTEMNHQSSRSHSILQVTSAEATSFMVDQDSKPKIPAFVSFNPS